MCCRVQKYFIKLAKAGLPVPGRVPNLSSYTKKVSCLDASDTPPPHPHTPSPLPFPSPPIYILAQRKIKRGPSKPSTFFLSLQPRVYMTSGGQQVAAEGEEEEEEEEQEEDEEEEEEEEEDTSVGSY